MGSVGGRARVSGAGVALACYVAVWGAGCSYRAQTPPARSGGATTQAPGAPMSEQSERGGAANTPPSVQPSGGESDGTTQLAGTSNPASDHTPLGTHTDECSVDRDCACGVDRSTGACAIGPVGRIDPNVQCPDFCMGITGVLHIACERGRCVQQTTR